MPQQSPPESSIQQCEEPAKASEHDPGGPTSQQNPASSENVLTAEAVHAFMDNVTLQTNENSYSGLDIQPEMCVGINSYVNSSAQNESKKSANPTFDDPMQDTSNDQSSLASFGADGTTATVNSYGNLMQMSKFLGVGRSGVISADSDLTDEPYEVDWRLRDLNYLSSAPFDATGFSIFDYDTPQLDFICDRWPRFTRAKDGYRVVVQYFAHNGIIFQQFIVEGNGGDPDSEWLQHLDDCTMEGIIQLRDLEWQDSNYKFNKEPFISQTCKTTLFNHDLSWVRSHTSLSDDAGENAGGRRNDDLAIELVVAVFRDGKVQELKLSEGRCSMKGLDENAQDDALDKLKKSKRAEVTVAYRLQNKSTENDWKSHCIQAQELIGLRNSLLKADFNRSMFSTNRDFDFTMRRNLEHIISVCCIPVNRSDYSKNAANLVAITCGDLSGHRVVTSASFFAFRFLISVYENLCNQLTTKARTDKHPRTQKEASKTMDSSQCVGPEIIQDLVKRIEGVCSGHFNWILQLEDAELTEEEEAFCSKYWTSGRKIRSSRGQGPGFLGSASFVDAAFQFIKVEVFLNSTVSPFKSKSIAEATEGKVPKEKPDGNRTGKSAERNREEEGTTLGEMGEPADMVKEKVKEDRPQKVEKEDICENSDKVDEESESVAKRRRLKEWPIEGDQPQGIFEDQKRPQEEGSIRKKIELRAHRWIDQLQKAQKRSERGPFAIPRSKDDVTGNDNYYLGDHFWIWRALRALENMGYEKVLNPQQASPRDRSGARIASENGPKSFRDKIYSSAEAQRHILKRFTTENPASTKRMLAVFRSSSETRFMFRSRDTALFYGMRHSLFSMAESNEVIDVWRNTLETQTLHRYNEPTGWSSPMRYALALIMASEGCPINSKPVGKMFQTSYRTLIGSSGVNGLFPGWLDEHTKQPEPLLEGENLEEYWHAAFEIPYIIWTCPFPRTDPGSGLRLSTQKGSIAKAQDIKTSKEVVITTKTLPFNNFIDQQSIIELQDEWLYNEPSFLDFDAELSSVKCKETIATAITSMKALGQAHPNDAIKQLGNCVSKLGSSLTFVLFSEYLDRHYSKSGITSPNDFHENFQKHQDLLITEFEELKKLELLVFMVRHARNKAPHGWPEILDGLLERLESRSYEHHGAFDVVPSTIRERQSLYQQFEQREEFPTGKGEKGVFFDVIRSSDKSATKDKRKHVKPNLEITVAKSNEEFMQTISSRRRESSGGKIVKKRLICLSRADEDTAILCSLASPWSIRDDLYRFFERHRCYEKYFFDETTAVLNTWRTEFHISFYQLHEKGPVADFKHLPKLDTAKVSKGKCISRAAMGFHFNGDFFDRYWTCHFIEFNIACGHIRDGPSQLQSDPDFKQRMLEILQPNEYLPRSEIDKQPWRQRKVLELILFDKMLKEITASTEDIVDHIRLRIREIIGDEHKEGTSNGLQDAVAFFQIKGSAYPHFSSESKKLEEILNVMEDNLSENLEQVMRWKNREHARSPERPRWTRNDERKYRPTITKLLTSTERRVRQVERCRATVQALKGYLASTREYIRDDLNLRGAEDVRLFTYVTATFLPIGFAASIFSMGGFPEAPVLGSMIGLTVVALLLTFVAIIRKKEIAHLIENLRKSGSATQQDGTQDHPTTESTAPGLDSNPNPRTTIIGLLGVRRALKNATNNVRSWFTKSNDDRLPTSH